MAQESTHLRDEVDILRHTAEKVVCIYLYQVLTRPILPGGQVLT